MDFGHAALMASSENGAALAAADLAGFELVARRLRELPISCSGASGVTSVRVS